MNKIIRLAYVSEATVNLNDLLDKPESALTKLLNQARINNRELNISGALFICDGYFFQCLEGKEKHINGLMNVIKEDYRHKNLKISYCKEIKKKHFADWTMKYVPVLPEIKQMMLNRGYLGFEPVLFDESDINIIIDSFSRAPDTSVIYQSYRPKFYWLKRLFRFRSVA